jgi:hypothetical protein
MDHGVRGERLAGEERGARERRARDELASDAQRSRPRERGRESAELGEIENEVRAGGHFLARGQPEKGAPAEGGEPCEDGESDQQGAARDSGAEARR